jgi:hypothetical protein
MEISLGYNNKEDNWVSTTRKRWDKNLFFEIPHERHQYMMTVDFYLDDAPYVPKVGSVLLKDAYSVLMTHRLFSWWGPFDSPALSIEVVQSVVLGTFNTGARRPSEETFDESDNFTYRLAVMADLKRHKEAGGSESTFWGSVMPGLTDDEKDTIIRNGTSLLVVGNHHTLIKRSERCLLCHTDDPSTSLLPEYTFCVELVMEPLENVILDLEK